MAMSVAEAKENKKLKAENAKLRSENNRLVSEMAKHQDPQNKSRRRPTTILRKLSVLLLLVFATALLTVGNLLVW
jgi:hypothetical protein